MEYGVGAVACSARVTMEEEKRDERARPLRQVRRMIFAPVGVVECVYEDTREGRPYGCGDLSDDEVGRRLDVPSRRGSNLLPVVCSRLER